MIRWIALALLALSTSASAGLMVLAGSRAVTSPPPVGNTELEQLVATMDSGEWAELETLLFEDASLVQGQVLRTKMYAAPGSYNTQFAVAASWDSVADQVIFMGASHCNLTLDPPDVCTRFVRYDVATNTWANNFDGTLPDPPAGAYPQDFGHAYYHNTFNSNERIAYFRDYGNETIFRFDNSTAAWLSSIVIEPQPMSTQVAGALVFFPDYGVEGSLVYYDGDFGCHRFDFDAASWSRICFGNAGGGSPQLTAGPYHNGAWYNSVEQAVFLGGGNGSAVFYRIDSNGSFTTLDNAPYNWGVTVTVTAYDPVSGKNLFIYEQPTDQCEFWEHDPSVDSWTQLPSGQEPPWCTGASLDGPVFGTLSVALPEYGVVMFINYESAAGQSAVWLYKH